MSYKLYRRKKLKPGDEILIPHCAGQHLYGL